MADVDAVRHLASERDLEYVDLDNYGVDPAASDILPPDLARRHQLAVIKRKFGTPVIATADPDDVEAHEAAREAIGRDFISVVASGDQITQYLDRLFPPEREGERRRGLRKSRKKTPEPTPEPPRVGETEALGRNLVELDMDELEDLDGGTNGRTNGAAVSLVEPPDGEHRDGALDVPEAVAEDAETDVEETLPAPDDELLSVADAIVEAAADAEAEIEQPDDGEATPEDDVATDEEVADLEDSATTLPEAEAGPGASAEVAGEESIDPSDIAVATEAAPVEPELMDEVVEAGEEDAEATDADETEAELTVDELVEIAVASEQMSGGAREEPLAEHDAAPPTDAPASDGGAADDEEEEIGLSRGISAPDDDIDLAGESGAANGESAGEVADFVVEAVATYQEQHAEDIDTNVQETSGTSTFPPLAKALVEGARVSVDDMRSALEEADQSRQNVAHILMARGLVTEADLMWGMAQEMGLEYVDLDTNGVNFAAVSLLPESTARHHNVIIIAEEDGRPVVATSNPTDVFAMDDLRTIIGRRFKVVVASRSQITNYIDKAFDTGADEVAMEASIEMDESSEGPDDIQAVTEEAPIVRYVNLLILQALNERASDIHIEPTGGELRIRYRIDGVLHDISTAPRSIRAAVTTRLKVMADMNIAEHRIPQDGRISLNVGSKSIDLRMATLPTINGEKVVMRVLDKSSVVLGFGDLGFDEELLVKYEQIFHKPYGTILVTGPTGSGKSTTLYTTLTALNSPDKNIITVEDPVELPLKGISQIQLNPKAGLTFASALRAILRSDPDIVLVGEIRDRETALISVEAALTGHLVLSTLHTNNAASSPMRLVEMGLEPFLVTSAISGVLAQRLARRLCVHCKEAYEATEAEIVAAGWTVEEIEMMGGLQSVVYRSVGCSACSNTGYRGRKALAELLPMTEEVERMIIEGGSMEEIHRLAVSQGMVTLRQSGLRKALEGETTLEEVLRVVA
jgi:type IV pilus assembly protein PilB